MAKVYFNQSTTKVSFDSFGSGHYFIYGDKLYLKISQYRAFSFDEDVIVPIDETTEVIVKLGNDIEITVK